VLSIQDARTLVYLSNSLLNNAIGNRKQPSTAPTARPFLWLCVGPDRLVSEEREEERRLRKFA